ncbi:MAG: carbamoyl-phosphate synthase large subunit [Candidatus Sumerlaeaceae bacterium]|nr:carbamoyl-phosphate synthase large subunit [Candidatus Sumerlaeaceae bacterium]
MAQTRDFKKVLIIGSGPIVIGQACEFDYSGTQGCKALREDGYEVVLVNSNPATIMTDPQFGDRTYIEPLTPEVVEAIIERERPQVVLPTLGGQTALNLAMDLDARGVLKKYGCRLIGATAEAIDRAENRFQFKQTMLAIGLDVPRSAIIHATGGKEEQILKAAFEALEEAQKIGFPIIIRPSFTMGGSGGGTAYNTHEFVEIAQRGLALSPTHEIMIEESVLGWKEFELEVMRDMHDNVVIVCSIENFDPMGVHTGDSITVAPIQTLTDREYQAMRDDARKIIRAIGVDTGGSNIQFAVNPETGRRIVIEMNPRVSRSSALASKATGFPIAKIAAKLATGLRLDELSNDITRKTPACFEPTIDYCVVKIPRFAFEKFPGAEAILGTQMKSVGETMAIGRTFKEALQKGLRGLEIGRHGLGGDGKFNYDPTADDVQTKLLWHLRNPNPDRIFWVRAALRGRVPDARGASEVYGPQAIETPADHAAGKSPHALMSVQDVHENTHMDPWFLDNIRELTDFEHQIASAGEKKLIHKPGQPTNRPTERAFLLKAKQLGFSDEQIAFLISRKRTKFTEWEIRQRRLELGIKAVFKSVDTCGGEFEAQTPYFYSTYEDASHPLANEAAPTERRKVLILGGGPNRIGQGIEFDYCCVQAVFALKAAGFETIMVNSNPETVSTDYDTADRLYFEPLTSEDVLNIIENECAKGELAGIIVQFGGQTPLKLAHALEKYIADNNLPTRIVGTSPDSIDLAEDRKRFGALLDELGIPSPANGSGRSFAELRELARTIGYPVMVRPSYVLGGRAMEIVYTDRQLREFMKIALDVSPEHPVLVDKFLDGAIEVDVDAICDYGAKGNPAEGSCVIAAIMEHIEEAGIHSGDSACVIPARTLAETVLSKIRDYTVQLGRALKVCGLMNIQYAVKDETVYVLEVNPRASRTVPYVSKTIGHPVAQFAARVMLGESLAEIGFTTEPRIEYFSVKEAVLPFNKFPGCEIRLGPEMRSTGEVMGIDPTAGLAFAKSQAASGYPLPLDGGVFMSVNDGDKERFLPLARELEELGFHLYATEGTHRFLKANGIASAMLNKIKEGRPNVVDNVINGRILLVINTFSGPQGRPDEKAIRTMVNGRGIPLITTFSAARAAVEGIAALRNHTATLKSIQEYHAGK